MAGGDKCVVTEGRAGSTRADRARALTVEQLEKGETQDESETCAPARHPPSSCPACARRWRTDAQGELGDPKSAMKGQYDPAHPMGLAKRRWAMTVDLLRAAPDAPRA